MSIQPSRLLIALCWLIALLALLALLAGAPVSVVGVVALAAVAVCLVAAGVDAWRSTVAWRCDAPVLVRELPAALALGVRTPVVLRWRYARASRRQPCWRLQVFDHADARFDLEGLPMSLAIAPGQQVRVSYQLCARERGQLRFAPAQLLMRSLGRLVELRCFVGPEQAVPVYPNFAQATRYAWLAADGRLNEMGIKTVVQRGEGTDFKSLAEYRLGQSLRHIDWKATLRRQRPIVREYQDERDQRVIFLLDCGRRMRADESQAQQRTDSHFDAALNAVMLLSYVALKQGDAVGALTFGHEHPAASVLVAPRKTVSALSGLMAALGHVQPEPAYSDYLWAARELMRVFRQRAWVVLITNFRDEDAPELAPALRLLRSRHRVLVASLRERVLDELMNAPLNIEATDSSWTIAAAHWFAQSRADAFARLAQSDGFLLDVLPEALPVALVNRYQAIKRAGLM